MFFIGMIVGAVCAFVIIFAVAFYLAMSQWQDDQGDSGISDE